ncbi:MAG: serine/threonine-protein kinase [Myxococcota bacterium]
MSRGAPSSGGLPPGTVMGRYELLHRLAMGGMAELYVARQSGIGGFERTVVLKRVLPHLVEDPEFTRMFVDEARIAASLDHPNIAQVTDIDEQDGECFFAMEYVHGRNLLQLLKESRDGLALSFALQIISAVAAGLHHAHEALGSDGRPLGLVHRDVSPSNVMVGYNGAVKLTDFGIAKASARTSKTVAGSIKGKVGYMSPEQCRGDIVDRRSDIFSLGILLYEVSTGARAFYAPNDFAAMGRIARADYIPPSEIDDTFPGALEQIIARALAKDPDDRYPTADELRRELDSFADAAGHTASGAELATFMTGLFGTPAHPQTLPAVKPVLRPVEEVSGGGTAWMRRRGISRGMLLTAVAGTAVAVGGVAFLVRPSPPTPRVSPEPASTPEPAAVLAEEPPPPAVVEEAPADPVPPVPEPVAEPAPAPEPVPRPAKKRKRPRPKKKAKPASDAPSRYPPGYER